LRKLLSVLMSLTIFASLSGATQAHERWRWDANDVGGRLDVKWAAIDHHNRRFHFGVQTYNRWRQLLLKRRANFIWIDMDTRRGRAMDYFAEVKYRRGRLRTRVYKIVDRPDTDVDGRRYVGYGSTEFRNRRLVLLRFQKGLVRPLRGYIRWRVVAATSRRYWDAVPSSGGLFRHSL